MVTGARGLALASVTDLVAGALGVGAALDVGIGGAVLVRRADVAGATISGGVAGVFAVGVDADLTSGAVSGAATLDGLAQPLAAALVSATLVVAGAGGDALAVDALAAVTLLVKDAGAVLGFALAVDADLGAATVVAVHTLGALRVLTLEVATDLACAASGVRVALGVVGADAAVVDAALTDGAILGADTLQLGVGVTGAAVVAIDGQTLRGGASLGAHVDALKGLRTIRVGLTLTSADLLAVLDPLIIVEADTHSAGLATVVAGLAALTQAGLTGLGVLLAGRAGAGDADAVGATVKVTDAAVIDDGGLGRLPGLFADLGAGRVADLVALSLVPALFPGLPGVLVDVADLVSAAVIVAA